MHLIRKGNNNGSATGMGVSQAQRGPGGGLTAKNVGLVTRAGLPPAYPHSPTQSGRAEDLRVG